MRRGEVVVLDPVQGVAEGHLAVLVVVAVAFAVGGDVGELRLGGWLVGAEAARAGGGRRFRRR